MALGVATLEVRVSRQQGHREPLTALDERHLPHIIRGRWRFLVERLGRIAGGARAASRAAAQEERLGRIAAGGRIMRCVTARWAGMTGAAGANMWPLYSASIHRPPRCPSSQRRSIHYYSNLSSMVVHIGTKGSNPAGKLS